jgi:hypothetical protein
MVFNLRIFAALAAEKYFFSAPQRLCGYYFYTNSKSSSSLRIISMNIVDILSAL